MKPPYPAFENEKDSQSILLEVARAVEAADGGVAGHCERLGLISVSLGVAMQLPREDLLTLYLGAYLHDIGNVGIPPSIRTKPAELTEDDWVAIRNHPLLGVEICKPLRSLAPTLPLIRSHHERWDGSGYPDGLTAEQIPLLSRILQLADIYDCLTSPRPYRGAHSTVAALDIIREECDRGWRDPVLVALFLERRVFLNSMIPGNLSSD